MIDRRFIKDDSETKSRKRTVKGVVYGVLAYLVVLMGVNAELYRGSAVPGTNQLIALTILAPVGILALTLGAAFGALTVWSWKWVGDLAKGLLAAITAILLGAAFTVFIQAGLRALGAFDQRFHFQLWD